MKLGTKVAVSALIIFGGLAAAVIAVAPKLVGPGMRFLEPFTRMRRSRTRLEAMVEQKAWKRPAVEALTAEQLDRFFAVRQRVDAARRTADPKLGGMPRRRVRSLQELKQVTEVMEDVGDMVTAELNAYVDAGITPDEYRWVARLVYTRWRSALKRAGTYPVSVRAAAAEVEQAAAKEADPRTRARLRAVAAEMRSREPAPPEGFDAETHRLLLARLDDVERWSLDDVMSPIPR